MGEPSEAQRLAAMKANMIADLGNIRRDAISTADDRGHAYNASQQQSTGDVQRRIQLKNIEKAAKKGDKKAEKLSAWNNAGGFQQDEVAEQLPDIDEGNSHREGVRERMRRGELRDDQRQSTNKCRQTVAERPTYLQGNYVTDKAGGKAKGSAPRSMPQPGPQPTRVPTRSGGSATPRPDGTARVRAPSPRAGGTVRFVAGRRRALASPAQRAPASANQPPRASTATSTSPLSLLSSGAPASSNNAGAALQQSVHAPPADSASTTESQSLPLPPHLRRRTEATSRVLPLPTPKLPTQSADDDGRERQFKALARRAFPASSQQARQQTRSAPQVKTTQQEPHVRDHLLRSKALMLAAQLDQNREDFLKSDPEASVYLQKALEIWAMFARGSYKEIERYQTKHPDLEIWCKAAECVYNTFGTAKPSSTAPAPAVINGSAPNTASAVPSSADDGTLAAGVTSAAEKPAGMSAATTSGQSPKPRTPSPFLTHIMNTTKFTPEELASKPAKAKNSPSSSNIESMSSSATVVPTQGQEVQAQSSFGNSTGATVSTQAPTLQSPQSHRNNSKETTPDSFSSAKSADTTITTPTVKRGVLTVALHDPEGNLISNLRYEVDAPVSANLHITSKNRSFDPSQLVEGIQDFAQNALVDRTRALSAAHMDDEGIWADDEDDFVPVQDHPVTQAPPAEPAAIEDSDEEL